MSEITIKTKEDQIILQEAGKRLGTLLQILSGMVAPGVSAKDLDDFAYDWITKQGDTPAFLDYTPEGVSTPYPATLCVSINEEIVHGIPHAEKVFKQGDIVSLDCGICHKGLFVDHAITVPVGKVSKEIYDLIHITQEAMYAGIDQARSGNTVGDIGHAIYQVVGSSYGTIRVLSGHGVGYSVHEPPYVPNYGKKGKGVPLIPGMVLAIEPMVTLGTDDVVFLDDEYTVITADHSLSAHFEHTVLITDGEPIILTQIS
jgi:methionyl aminopeptidase